MSTTLFGKLKAAMTAQSSISPIPPRPTMPQPLTANKYMKTSYTGMDAGQAETDMSQYFPEEVAKPFVRELLRRMSEDDCKKLIQLTVEALSHDTNTIKMSESIETAIISFQVDKLA